MNRTKNRPKKNRKKIPICKRTWWCVVDFDDDYIILRVGKGSTSSIDNPPSRFPTHEDFIIGVDPDEAQHIWGKFNEITYSSVPKNLRELRRRAGLRDLAPAKTHHN